MPAQVIGETHRRHRSIEFKRFLDGMDAEVPADFGIHIVIDNNSTHKTPLVKRWLQRHPRGQLHFTPTYSSWINQVERWFALLTEKQLRRATRKSSRQLADAIRLHLTTANQAAKPFSWTAADEIVASVANRGTDMERLVKPKLTTDGDQGRARRRVTVSRQSIIRIRRCGNP